MNSIGGSCGWEKESAERVRSERAGILAGYATGLVNEPEEEEENKMRQVIANSWQGTLLEEIKAGKTKMSRRRPQAR